MICVQSGNALATTLFVRVHVLGAVMLRLGFGALVLVAFARPSPRAWSRADRWTVLVFGLVIAGMNLCMYEALARIPLGAAVTVAFLGPLAVAVAGSRRRVDLIWPVVAAIGVVLLAGAAGVSGAGTNLLGLLFALGCAAGWAGYIILSASTGARFPGVGGLALAMVLGAAVSAPAGIAAAGARLLAPRNLALGAATGVLAAALPYGLETEALRRVVKPVFGVFASMEPAVATLVGVVILGQQSGAGQLLGMALVVLASMGASLSRGV